jgi:hypothetical protein
MPFATRTVFSRTYIYGDFLLSGRLGRRSLKDNSCDGGLPSPAARSGAIRVVVQPAAQRFVCNEPRTRARAGRS